MAATPPLGLPTKLFGLLCERAVPATSNGAVWVSTKVKEAAPEFLEAFRSRPAVGEDAFFGASLPAYVPPREFGYELPKGGAPEVAFAGRSNVGKSSLLGALVKNKSLCRRSKRPGCTATVNYYRLRGLQHESFLVDLPGFGYAQRSKREQAGFSEVTVDYLAQRDRIILRHIVLLIDARRGLRSEGDLAALGALQDLAVSHHVVLTKADLVKPPDLAVAIGDVFTNLHTNRRLATCLPFLHVASSKNNFGVNELRDFVASFLTRSN